MVHITLMFILKLCEFPSAPCLAGKKKLDNSSRLDVVEIARVAFLLPFSLWNKKRLAIRHMNRPLCPTSVSIQSYSIGKYFGLRTYQQRQIYIYIVGGADKCLTRRTSRCVCVCMYTHTHTHKYTLHTKVSSKI